MLNKNWNQENMAWRDIEKNIDKNVDCTKEDKALIRDFVKDKKRVDHIRDGRAETIAYNLMMFRRFLGVSFDRATIDDITNGIEAFKHGESKPINNRAAKPYSKNTVNNIVIILKDFLLWLADEDAIKPHKHAKTLTEHRIRKFINAPGGKDASEVLRKEQILREEEILKMVGVADCQRNRSIVFLTYESGCRIGEVSTLHWRDLVFERVGEEGKEVETAKLYITDHKGREKRRYVRLTMSVIDLIAHKNLSKPSDDDFIFLQDGLHEKGINEPMTRRQYARVFEHAAEKAEIVKPINPHAFRHARATELIRQGYDETTIKMMLWNNITTKMFKVYVALCDDDIDKEVFKRTGIRTMLTERDERLKEVRAPRPCPVCHAQNAFDAEICSKCGSPVSPDGIKKALKAKASEVDTVEAIIARKLTELGLTPTAADSQHMTKTVEALASARAKALASIKKA
jgi:integrase/ribosomal protein L40E